jgi:chromosome segregation ATPase
VRKIDEELKVKAFFVDDLTKTFQALVEKSRNLHELYEVLKKEKNKYAAMIQFAKQRVLESNEKARILESEIEILRSTSLTKSRQLLKQSQELANINSSRNAVRGEINKITAAYRERKEHVDQHLSQIEVLQSKVDNREWMMTKHRRDYEVALQQRNHIAQQLLERNDELCVLYQRQSLQDKTFLHAEHELGDRDADIKRCRIEIDSLKREIIMLRDTNILMVKNKDEFERMWQEFTELRAYEYELMQYFHDPMNAKGEYANRINMMVAQDPSMEALQEKITKVTQDITNTDEALLAKKMILKKLEDEIKEFNSKIKTARKEHMPCFEELDQMSKRITKTDRDLMSHISELSMVQAKVMDLQQQKQELEERLQEGPIRTEAEQEWHRYEKRQRRMQQFKQNQERQVQELMHRLGLDSIAGQAPDKIDLVGRRFLFRIDDGRFTTAVQRPDAYIPLISDGPAKQLAISRPYGSLAPFKPSDESHNIQRYIRPPVDKPIEY